MMPAAHTRVCLIEDPPARPLPPQEFLAIHAACGTGIAATLLDVDPRTVRARVRALRRPDVPKLRRKATPRVTERMRLAARLEALRSGISTLELRVGMLAGERGL